MKLKDSERGYLFVMRFYKKDMDQNRKLSLFVRTAGKYSNCILYTNIILYVFIFMYFMPDTVWESGTRAVFEKELVSCLTNINSNREDKRE